MTDPDTSVPATGEHNTPPVSRESLGKRDDGRFDASPIKQAALHRAFVLGGPLCLAVAVFASLWVSAQRVRHCATVWIERTWLPGERLALRTRFEGKGDVPLPGAEVRVWVEQAGRTFALPEPEVVGALGLAQMTFTVPETLSHGTARLRLEFNATSEIVVNESVDVDVVAKRPRIPPIRSKYTSKELQADDTDPQPERMRLDARVMGRLLSGFGNELSVRALLPDGRPYRGELETLLLGGELSGRKGSPDRPVVLDRGRTDELGLRWIRGVLDSDILRLEVRALDERGMTVATRRFRMLSLPGAVQVQLSTRSVLSGDAIEVQAASLSARRPIFLDIYGPDGAWAETLSPPFVRGDPRRSWAWHGEEGLLHLVAYQFTSGSGESAAVRRAHVVFDETHVIAPLIAAQREELDVPRAEKGFDPELERAFLSWLAEDARLGTRARNSAQVYLQGTLPLTRHSPPLALETRQRDVEQLSAWKRRWTIGLRLFLLGGGALFLFAMTIAMVRAHAASAAATTRALGTLTGSEERGLAAHLSKAKRRALLHGLGVILVMAGGLILLVIMLESFVWLG